MPLLHPIWAILGRIPLTKPWILPRENERTVRSWWNLPRFHPDNIPQEIPQGPSPSYIPLESHPITFPKHNFPAPTCTNQVNTSQPTEFPPLLEVRLRGVPRHGQDLRLAALQTHLTGETHGETGQLQGLVFLNVFLIWNWWNMLFWRFHELKGIHWKQHQIWITYWDLTVTDGRFWRFAHLPGKIGDSIINFFWIFTSKNIPARSDMYRHPETSDALWNSLLSKLVPLW